MKASKLLLFFALLLLVTACVALFSTGRLSLKIAMAEEQVKIFDSMRLKALASSPREAAECLAYVENYYPSGTKQASGSRLDTIVETARAASTREIIAHLRTKTRSSNLGVLIKGNEKWFNLGELHELAKNNIGGKFPSVDWNKLKEANCWVDPADRTNLATIHFSFGLGKQSFLVSFNKRGELNDLQDAIAVDSVEGPGFVPIK